MPEMIPVKSAAIAAAGYDPQAKTLTVQFHNGKTHTYSDVSQATYEQFVASPSKGKFLNERLK